MTTPLKIGTYQLGWRWVDVFADPTSFGGTFKMIDHQNEGEHAKITVGFKDDKISDAMEVLTHEALEFLLGEHNYQFHPTRSYAPYATDAYHFMFDHNGLTEVAAKLGCFLWNIHDVFKAAFDLIEEAKK